MISAAWTEADDSDKCLFVIDAKKGIAEEEKKILDRLTKNQTKFTIVVNKIDTVKPDKLALLLEKLNGIKGIEYIWLDI